MAKFIKHIPCPQCQAAGRDRSGNNLSVYDDGFMRCENNVCDYIVYSNSNRPGQAPKSNFGFTFGEHPVILEQIRGLKCTTIRDYRVTIREKEELRFVSYPHIHSGKVIGCKNRYVSKGSQNLYPDKQFSIEGTITNSLFGFHLFEPNGDKPVLITEGEVDAMSAYQMLDGEYHCLSVPNGSSGAKGAIAANKEAFGDRKIFICFDNDEAGESASEQCMKIFPSGQAFLVVLPDGYKDANDMSLAGRAEEFKQAVATAKPILPKSYVDFDTVRKRAIDDFFNKASTENTFTSGYTNLDGLMVGGFRCGELITIVAGTGKGKTTFTMNIAYNVMKDNKILYVPLEMSTNDIFMRFVELEMNQLITLMTQEEKTALSENSVYKASEVFKGKLELNDHIGSYSTKDLIELIRFHAVCNDVKFVVIDHIHNAANHNVDAAMHEHLDVLVGELKKAAMDYNCCIWVVAQQSRDAKDKLDNMTALNKIRGSQGIAHNSDMVLGLEHEYVNKIHTNRIVIRPLKPHRIKGKGDDIVFDYNENTRKYYVGTTIEEGAANF